MKTKPVSISECVRILETTRYKVDQLLKEHADVLDVQDNGSQGKLVWAQQIAHLLYDLEGDPPAPEKIISGEYAPPAPPSEEGQGDQAQTQTPQSKPGAPVVAEYQLRQNDRVVDTTVEFPDVNTIKALRGPGTYVIVSVDEKGRVIKAEEVRIEAPASSPQQPAGGLNEQAMMQMILKIVEVLKPAVSAAAPAATGSSDFFEKMYLAQKEESREQRQEVKDLYKILAERASNPASNHMNDFAAQVKAARELSDIIGGETSPIDLITAAGQFLPDIIDSIKSGKPAGKQVNQGGDMLQLSDYTEEGSAKRDNNNVQVTTITNKE